jgi:hypothetical protein
MYPHNTKRACTILLFAKKIKKFYSFPNKHLAISGNRKIENFRTNRASLCKGWRDYVFFSCYFLAVLSGDYIVVLA